MVWDRCLVYIYLYIYNNSIIIVVDEAKFTNHPKKKNLDAVFSEPFLWDPYVTLEQYPLLLLYHKHYFEPIARNAKEECKNM